MSKKEKDVSKEAALRGLDNFVKDLEQLLKTAIPDQKKSGGGDA